MMTIYPTIIHVVEKNIEACDCNHNLNANYRPHPIHQEMCSMLYCTYMHNLKNNLFSTIMIYICTFLYIYRDIYK